MDGWVKGADCLLLIIWTKIDNFFPSPSSYPILRHPNTWWHKLPSDADEIFNKRISKRKSKLFQTGCKQRMEKERKEFKDYKYIWVFLSFPFIKLNQRKSSIWRKKERKNEHFLLEHSNYRSDLPAQCRIKRISKEWDFKRMKKISLSRKSHKFYNYTLMKLSNGVEEE